MKSRDRVSLLIGAVVLIVSVLFVGGALRWVQGVVALLVAAALGVQVMARRRLVISPLVVLIGLAILLTLLQLLPMPEVVLGAMTEVGTNLRHDGASLAQADPWPSISLDPAGTLRTLGFFTILFGVAVVALRLSVSERARFMLVAGVAGACGLAALVAGVHEVLALDALFGIYEPVHATSAPILGPLLNANHLGSLMSLGATLSTGLAFYGRQPVQLRVAWVVSTIACSAVCFATLSRGATLALILGVGVVGTILLAGKLLARERRRSRLRSDLPIAVVVVLGLGLAVFTSAGRVADQLDSTSLAELDQPVSKYAAWRTSLHLVEEAPILGIGRGATESVFTRVFEPSGQVTFSHLENEYVQAVVEWGIGGTLILAIAFGWCVSVALRRWRGGALPAAALGGVTAVLFQSTVDFAVELLGLAVPLTIVGATLLYGPITMVTSRWWRLLRGALILGLVAAAITLFSSATRTIQEDHDELQRLDSEAAIVEVIERHPLDYFAFGQLASRLARERDPRAVRFLNHAMTLHPTHPGLHRLAAHILIDKGRHAQAALELSFAMKWTRFPSKLLAEIVGRMPTPELAAAAIPTDYRRPDLVLRSLKDLGRDDVAMRWLERVIATPQTTTDQIDRLYTLAFERRDYERALVAARARSRLAHTSTSRLMLARVHFRRNEHQAVLDQLEDVASWTGPVDERWEAWMLVCDIHLARRAWDPSLECLHKLDGSGLASAGKREGILRRLKDINNQRAVEARSEALQRLQQSIHDGTPKP